MLFADLPADAHRAILERVTPARALFTAAAVSRYCRARCKEIGEARTVHVPATPGALETCVEAAYEGSTVVLEDGVHVCGLLRLNKPVRIMGKGGAVLTSSAQQICHAVAPAVLENFTLLRGHQDTVAPQQAMFLAAVYAEECRLTIRDCRIAYGNDHGTFSVGSTPPAGGAWPPDHEGPTQPIGSHERTFNVVGVRARCATLSLDGTHVYGFPGPSCSSTRSKVDVHRCTFAFSSIGACVVLNGGTTRLRSSTIQNTESAPGVSSHGSADLSVANCSIQHNRHGGMMINSNGALTIVDNAFESNGSAAFVWNVAHPGLRDVHKSNVFQNNGIWEISSNRTAATARFDPDDSSDSESDFPQLAPVIGRQRATNTP